MNLVQHIQDRLHDLYNVDVEVNARDFLIGCKELSELLNCDQNTIMAKELFLVNPHPQDETVEVALYLQDAVCENLANNYPLKEINQHNLSDLCVLIEGVSHFVYYLYQSAQQNNVSQLELELQAEIDKFLLILQMTGADKSHALKVMNLLFEDYKLQEHLSAEQKLRYQDANQLARRYCYELTQNSSNWVEDVREFYSLSHQQKIHKILNY